jgi:hypothetical protein
MNISGRNWTESAHLNGFEALHCKQEDATCQEGGIQGGFEISWPGQPTHPRKCTIHLLHTSRAHWSKILQLEIGLFLVSCWKLPPTRFGAHTASQPMYSYLHGFEAPPRHGIAQSLPTQPRLQTQVPSRWHPDCAEEATHAAHCVMLQRRYTSASACTDADSEWKTQLGSNLILAKMADLLQNRRNKDPVLIQVCMAKWKWKAWDFVQWKFIKKNINTAGFSFMSKVWEAAPSSCRAKLNPYHLQLVLCWHNQQDQNLIGPLCLPKQAWGPETKYSTQNRFHQCLRNQNSCLPEP